MRDLAVKAADSRRTAVFRWAGLFTGALIILVGAFDVVSSNAVLSAGVGFEVNPLHRWTQMNWGQWWFVPKMAIHAGVATMVMWFPSRTVLAMMAPAIALTTFVVWSNFQLAI